MSTCNLKDEIILKRKLIEATDSVRKKFKALKAQKSVNLSDLEQFYEPVTTRLESMSETLAKQSKLPSAENTFNTSPSDKTDTGKYGRESLLNESNLKMQVEEGDLPSSPESLITQQDEYATPKPEQTMKQKQLSFSPEGKKNHGLAMEYLNKLKQNHTNFDQMFGIYINHNNKFCMGDTEVLFSSAGKIMFRRGSTIIGNYPVTEELLDLIFLKQPKALANVEGLNDDTKKIYSEILFKTNSLYKNFNPDLKNNRNSSRKYKEIIQPLIHKKGGNINTSLVPNEKIYKKKNIQYVYWNNVKELVDRLRLLWSSKQAGDSGQNNEIIAIIEELREEGIIY